MGRFRSSFKTPKVSPGFLLWQVTNDWQRKQREVLRPLGLTHVQFVLLACIGWLQENREGEISQADVAAQAKTDLMMTSQVVRTLEKKRWLERKHSKTDARAFSLALTDAGWKLIQKALQLVEATDRAFFARLDKSQDFFTKALGRLTQ